MSYFTATKLQLSGTGLVENNPKTFILETATKTLDKLADGELVTIDSKGNVTKSTLSKTDKASVLKNLQKLNGNGLTPKQQTQEDKKKKICCL